jgi:putative nucleotidyltransferase with HDIG domain
MIRKVLLDDLTPGMYVEDVGIHWIDAPFLYSCPGIIRSDGEVDALRRQGFKYAYVDMAKSAIEVQERAGHPPDSLRGQDVSASPAVGTGPDKPLVPLKEELHAAARTYTETLQFVRRFFDEIRQERIPTIEGSQQYVNAVIDSVIRNQNALLNLFKLRTHDEYTYTHSVNVAILAIVLARFQGCAREEQLQLGMAGLFHDIGKERIPRHILRKPGRLTDAEYRIVRRHPEEGYAIMQGQAEVGERVLRPILEHHEKHNGTGYPGGLTGQRIDTFSSIVTIADIYDALTSDRIYKKPLILQRALQLIYAMRGEEIRSDLVEQFIKCLGVYPVGSFVRLSSGAYAVVIEVDTERMLLPKVRILLDASRHPIKPRLVDLAQAGNQGKDGLQIHACVDPCELDASLGRTPA